MKKLIITIAATAVLGISVFAATNSNSASDGDCCARQEACCLIGAACCSE